MPCVSAPQADVVEFAAGKFLEIAICDDCLLARKQRVEEVLSAQHVQEVSRRPADLG